MPEDLMNVFDNKVIAMVGNWEPMFHRTRGGNWRVNEKELYDREHSEEMAKQLADDGINFVIMHFYKGMGLEVEKPDMEDTKRFIEHCHKYGIKVGTYTQWGTFWNELFLKEHPDAMDFCQRDQFGRASFYSEIGFSYHRNRVCATNKKFREFLKKVIKYSVEYVGTDMVYFDNIGQNPCYCDGCKKAFPEYIAKKFPTEKDRIERFGFADLDAIQIPSGVYWRPIHCMDTVGEPLVQEWVNYRCDLLNEGFEDIRKFLDTLDRKVPLGINPPVLYGDNPAMAWGTDWFSIMKSTRFFYSEDPHLTGVQADGHLASQHRCYKTALARDNSCFRFHCHVDGDVRPELVAIAEAATLNDGNCANVKDYGTILKPLEEKKKAYINYIRTNEKDYAGVEQVSEVAVYKNFESLSWAWTQVFPKLSVIEQLLIQSGTQFSYLLNDEFENLDKYKTLVIADMLCLPTEYAEKIAEFVKQGGGLLVTGQSASHDLTYRRYEFNPLAQALGRKVENTTGATFLAIGLSEQHGSEKTSGDVQKWKFGKGRVCWIPQVEMEKSVDPTPPEQIHTMIHGDEFWVVPKNSQEILEGLDWTLGSGRWIPTDCPSNVVPQVSRPTDGDGLCVHLINYDAQKRVENLKLTISKDLFEPELATWRTPENSDAQPVNFMQTETGIELSLPAWDHHGTIILK